ncbi:DUF3052 family protein [Corallococcus sp. EGB]|uniref:DUF3052 family protein n=1 Tax=Corallococcus sp. EGB TaxID=1521117 RepID=UPI001CBF4A9A|nr:DUF3052 family protein [Corallococcus sp. EGB]
MSFRGDVRFNIPVKSVLKVHVVAGALKVTTAEGVASLELGQELAEKWAHKLLNPRSLLDKLGVKAGQKVCTLGVKDAAFREELTAKLGAAPSNRVLKDSDLLFFAVETAEDLERLTALQQGIKRDGAIWIIRPKGKASRLSDGEVLRAAKASGLTVVKVAKFSETYTAEKLVIPVAQR